MGQTHNSCEFRQVYSLHLNIIDRDLPANRPDPVRILDVGTMTSHSHHIDRANSTGGGCGMASKITKQDVRGCLSTAVLPRDCHSITLYWTHDIFVKDTLVMDILVTAYFGKTFW